MHHGITYQRCIVGYHIPNALWVTPPWWEKIKNFGVPSCKILIFGGKFCVLYMKIHEIVGNRVSFPVEKITIHFSSPVQYIPNGIWDMEFLRNSSYMPCGKCVSLGTGLENMGNEKLAFHDLQLYASDY